MAGRQAKPKQQRQCIANLIRDGEHAQYAQQAAGTAGERALPSIWPIAHSSSKLSKVFPPQEDDREPAQQQGRQEDAFSAPCTRSAGCSRRGLPRQASCTVTLFYRLKWHRQQRSVRPCSPLSRLLESCLHRARTQRERRAQAPRVSSSQEQQSVCLRQCQAGRSTELGGTLHDNLVHRWWQAALTGRPGRRMHRRPTPEAACLRQRGQKLSSMTV